MIIFSNIYIYHALFKIMFFKKTIIVSYHKIIIYIYIYRERERERREREEREREREREKREREKANFILLLADAELGHGLVQSSGLVCCCHTS